VFERIGGKGLKKAFFAGLWIAVAGSALAQVDPARVVATVNGVEIKGSEYYRRMEFLPGVGRNLGDGFAEFPPGFLTLEQLITEKLIFQLAKTKGVTPSDPEVQDELRYRLTKNPKLLQDYIDRGRTRAELEYEVKFDLVQFKLLTAGITVTDQEVEKYYNTNKPLFTTPVQLTLRVIVARTGTDATLVDKDLAAGKPFAEVAKARSADVTASRGGEYGTVPLDYLAPNVRSSIATLKAGQTTQWFEAADTSAGPKTDAPRFKFLIEKVTPERLLPLDADLKRQARQKLMMDRGKVQNHLKADLMALRTKSTIDIKEKGFADAYKKFLDAFLKNSGG
jgi:parvulin-like peptidyl-prolyl isomerase